MVPFAGYSMPVQYPGRDPGRAPPMPAPGGVVRRLAHGPVAAARATTRRRRWRPWCRSTSSTCGMDKQRYALFMNEQARPARRPDDHAPRGRAVRHRQRGLQGRRPGNTCASASARAAEIVHAARACAARVAGARWPCMRSHAWRPGIENLVFMTGGFFAIAGIALLRHALGLYGRRRLRDLGGRPREAHSARARSCSRSRKSRPSASARAIRCASKPACACTATTSTRRPRRSKRR